MPLIAADRPDRPDLGARWSPDGTRVAFSQPGWVEDDGTPTGGVFIWTAESSVVTNIDPAGGPPLWSRDGQWIVYEKMHGTIAKTRLDGSETVALAAGHSPTWSPGSDAIAYGDTGTAGGELRIIEGDGSGMRSFADCGTDGLPGPGAAVWSPDGSLLAVGCESPHPGFYVVAADGSDRRLVPDTGPDGRVAWQAVAPVPLVHVDTTTGVWMLRDGSGYVHDFYFGNPGDIPVMGDWTCDGETTPGLYRPSDGYAYLRNTNTQGNADRTFYFGNPGDIPLAGDWNGDGCDTLSIYRPATQEFHIINHLGAADTGLGAAETSFVFGNPGDTPVVGDWDGDGIDEIGLYRESSGYFYYRTTLTTGIADGQFYYGNPGDRFIAGDWTGDGNDTPAIYRPTMNRFYFKDTLTTGPADHTFTWGNPTWTPLTGTFQLP